MATRSRARVSASAHPRHHSKQPKSSKRKATYVPRNPLDPKNYERFGEGLRSWMVDVSVKLSNIEQLVIELHKKIDPDTLVVDIGKEDALEDLSPRDLSDSQSEYSSDLSDQDDREEPKLRERSFSRSRSPSPLRRRHVRKSSPHDSHHSHNSSPKSASAVEEVKAAVEALRVTSQLSPPKARRSRRTKEKVKKPTKPVKVANPTKVKSPVPEVVVVPVPAPSHHVHTLPERLTQPKTPSPLVTKSPALTVPTFFPPSWTNREEEERFIDSEF